MADHIHLRALAQHPKLQATAPFASHLVVHHSPPHTRQQGLLLRCLAQCRQPPFALPQQLAPILQAATRQQRHRCSLLALTEAVHKAQQSRACCCCEVRVKGMVWVHEHGHDGAGQLQVNHTAQQVGLLLLNQTRRHGWQDKRQGAGRVGAGVISVQMQEQRGCRSEGHLGTGRLFNQSKRSVKQQARQCRTQAPQSCTIVRC